MMPKEQRRRAGRPAREPEKRWVLMELGQVTGPDIATPTPAELAAGFELTPVLGPGVLRLFDPDAEVVRVIVPPTDGHPDGFEWVGTLDELAALGITLEPDDDRLTDE